MALEECARSEPAGILTSAEQEYQNRFLSLGPAYLHFPEVIGIETLALCNAACDFCPYPGLERKGDSMPDRLVTKILDDIQTVSSRPPFRFNLSRVNEPFLDPRIFDISQEINRRFPEAGHAFFSNGTPLNERNLLRLASIRNVCFLNVSVNDHRPEEYERTMGLPYARILARLDLLHRMKSAGILGFPVIVSRVGDGTAADSEFRQWVGRRYPDFQVAINARGDWIGAVPAPIIAAPDIGCTQWFKLHFLADGRSPFCCIDSDARRGAGSAESCHVIHEVYNTPARLEIRTRLLSRRAIDFCRSCPILV